MFKLDRNMMIGIAVAALLVLFLFRNKIKQLFSGLFGGSSANNSIDEDELEKQINEMPGSEEFDYGDHEEQHIQQEHSMSQMAPPEEAMDAATAGNEHAHAPPVDSSPMPSGSTETGQLAGQQPGPSAYDGSSMGASL
mgnify:CR=1 FL=1